MLSNWFDLKFDLIAFSTCTSAICSPLLSKIHSIKQETKQLFPSSVVVLLVMVCFYVKFMSLQLLLWLHALTGKTHKVHLLTWSLGQFIWRGWLLTQEELPPLNQPAINHILCVYICILKKHSFYCYVRVLATIRDHYRSDFTIIWILNDLKSRPSFCLSFFQTDDKKKTQLGFGMTAAILVNFKWYNKKFPLVTLTSPYFKVFST